jgi:hypothetical protein
MTAISASTTGGGSAVPSPGKAFGAVLNTAIGMAVAKLERKVAQWSEKSEGAVSDEVSETLVPLAEEGLDEVAEAGGPAQAAGAEGVKASLQGKNPVWGAIKGAWHSGTPVVRAAIIAGAVAAIVLLLVSPVLLLIFLLSLLVVAGVTRARAAKT